MYVNIHASKNCLSVYNNMLLSTIITITITGILADAENLLPDPSSCGYQNAPNESTSDNVSLSEFPWMAHIKISNLDFEYEFASRCIGVLISDRYVLTGAYCGAGAVKVILGQYNTNENFTCHEPICTNPKIEISVEEEIRNGKIQNGPYDLSLLRLQKKITFSDFVRPICLNLNGNESPKRLIVSGWGAFNSDSVAKKRMEYKVVSDEVCYSQQSYLKNNIEFANVSFICTLPDTRNKHLACNGDRGGPYMYKSHSNQWFVEGVVIEVMHPDDESNDFNTCTKERPVNGIRITADEINWIRASIRP